MGVSNRQENDLTLWAVDDILPSHENASQVRFVSIRDDAPGQPRYLQIDSSLVNQAPSSIYYNRIFQIEWRKLTDKTPDGYVWVNAQQMNRNDPPVRRNEIAEKQLSNEIEGYLNGAEVAQNESLPPISDDPTSYCLSILVLNVGQGDTLALVFADGDYYLLDIYTWSSNRLTNVRDFIKTNGGRTLRKILISHFHYDHIRKAAEVIQTNQPNEVLVPNHVHLTGTARNLLRESANRGILRVVKYPITFQRPPSIIAIVPTAHPPLGLSLGNDPNNHALLVRCCRNSNSAVLSGDLRGKLLEQAVRFMSWGGTGKNTRLYKVTHHGSETGHSPSLLTTLNPTCAATSYGRGNRFNHPHNPPQNDIRSFVGANNYHTTPNGSILVQL